MQEASLRGNVAEEIAELILDSAIEGIETLGETFQQMMEHQNSKEKLAEQNLINSRENHIQ